MIRRIPRLGIPLALLLVVSTVLASQAEDTRPSDTMRDRVVQGLALVQKGARQYPEHRACFSCHHQTLPMLAMVKAKGMGIGIDAALLRDQGEFSLELFREKQETIARGIGVGGSAMTVGYALWAAALAEREPDETTDALVAYLIKTQQGDGSWRTSGRRPPLEESNVTCSVLAAEGITKYGRGPLARQAKQGVEKARLWLLSTPVKTQEDRNFRLRGLDGLGAPEAKIEKARRDVLAAQREDGGWASRDDLSSDAYATGQALVCLAETGLETKTPAYRKGLEFLRSSQYPDGSWKVETRVKPIQVYFDNGDPHGKHQFISIPATAWAVAAIALAEVDSDEHPEFDLVIRGGTIIDGTGNPWFQGDLAIREDRIVKLGSLAPDARSLRSIDAKGLVVSPGFIDMHSHSDFTLFEDGRAESKIRQGVTTEVLGEDRSGGPAKGLHAPGKASIPGREKPLEWTRFGEYLDALEQAKISTNVASYVGLGTLLECALGNRLDRPGAAELENMTQLLEEALQDGAFGLSTMLAGARELNVETDDLATLCQVLPQYGGIYSSHLRNEGTEVMHAVREAIEVGERARVPVDIIHLKIADQSHWGRMEEIIRLIDDARRRGVNVQANVYPYTRGNNDLVTIIPPWAHEGGKEALVKRLQSPEVRTRLRHEIRKGIPGWYNHYTAVGGDWSRMLLSANLTEPNRRFQGLTMDKVLSLRTEGRDPVPDPLDELFDFLIEEKGSISTIYAHHTEEDMNLALSQPWCSIGSDGSALAVEGPLRRGHPHPRNFGTFPRVLGLYARERKLLSLEEAVRKMTSLNASKLGLMDRGLLRAGQFADITIFDPVSVRDKSTYLDPFAYSEGIVYVIVNGEVVLEQGRHTGAKPGRALRKNRPAAS